MVVMNKKLLFALLLLAPYLIAESLAQEPEGTYAIWGDPKEGGKIYAQNGCGNCHSINGIGPTIGPDLAKPFEKFPTISQMAGIMWNHAPEMRKVAGEKGLVLKTLKGEEMRDLIAFLYFLQLQDKKGNIRTGQRLWDEKRCSTCHSIGGKGSKIASDLSDWKQYKSPVLWAEIMWEHTLDMGKKMQAMGLEWPEFKDDDFVDLISFIQSQAN